LGCGEGGGWAQGMQLGARSRGREGGEGRWEGGILLASVQRAALRATCVGLSRRGLLAPEPTVPPLPLAERAQPPCRTCAADANRSSACARARVGTSVRVHMCGLHAHPHAGAYLRAACARAHWSVAMRRRSTDCSATTAVRRAACACRLSAPRTRACTRTVCANVCVCVCVGAPDACTALRIGLSSDSRQRPALLSELSTLSTLSTNNP
jgi:hypothetical protein